MLFLVSAVLVVGLLYTTCSRSDAAINRLLFDDDDDYDDERRTSLANRGDDYAYASYSYGGGRRGGAAPARLRAGGKAD